MFSRTVSSEEKTPDEVRALIKKTYGIEPAKTLDQMLYKRVAKGKRSTRPPKAVLDCSIQVHYGRDALTQHGRLADNRESKRGLVLRPLLLWLLSSLPRWPGTSSGVPRSTWGAQHHRLDPPWPAASHSSSAASRSALPLLDFSLDGQNGFLNDISHEPNPQTRSHHTRRGGCRRLP